MIDGNPLTHGALNDDKNLLVFIDGTTESGGNALNLLLRCTEPSTAVLQILLMKEDNPAAP